MIYWCAVKKLLSHFLPFTVFLSSMQLFALIHLWSDTYPTDQQHSDWKSGLVVSYTLADDLTIWQPWFHLPLLLELVYLTCVWLLVIVCFVQEAAAMPVGDHDPREELKMLRDKLASCSVLFLHITLTDWVALLLPLNPFALAIAA